MSFHIQSLPLYWQAIGKARFKFHSLINFAGTYMYENKKGTSKYSVVGEEGVAKMMKSFAILSFIICTSMSLVSLGPMRLFFRTGIWITPLGTQFPYADKSDIAFYLDLLIQMFIAILGTCSTISIEMANVIVNNAVDTAADVIKLNIELLTEEMVAIKKMNRELRAKFRNIIQQIQDFDQYVCFFFL